MNFLGCRTLTGVPGTDLHREDSLFVDSRGVVTHVVRYAFPCAQGRHPVTEVGPCPRCEQEWWWSQGFVRQIDGFFAGALKIAHEEAPVLVAQGWQEQRRTATYTYLLPPESEDEIPLPLYDPDDIPAEVRRGLSTTVAHERPAVTQAVITRLSRKGLMAYKREADALTGLEAHLAYLEKAEGKAISRS